jgi:hypothetical protein
LLDRGDAQGLFEIPTPTCAASACGLARLSREKNLETAIRKTEGFSFVQLRETYILGAQFAFEQGREIAVRDVVEAVELPMAGACDLKTSVAASGFVNRCEPSASRK